MYRGVVLTFKKIRLRGNLISPTIYIFQWQDLRRQSLAGRHLLALMNTTQLIDIVGVDPVSNLSVTCGPTLVATLEVA